MILHFDTLQDLCRQLEKWSDVLGGSLSAQTRRGLPIKNRRATFWKRLCTGVDRNQSAYVQRIVVHTMTRVCYKVLVTFVLPLGTAPRPEPVISCAFR